VDITESLRKDGFLIGEHYNDHDTVWQWRGTMVKVKTFFDTESPMGFAAYRMTGSIVGEDGKALRNDLGEPFIYQLGFVFTLQANEDIDENVELAKARARLVMETARAHHQLRRAPSLRGVGVMQGATRKPFLNPVEPPEDLRRFMRSIPSSSD
jgi:hypothetical protein